MLLAPLFGLPLALLPAQILWINLVTHGLPGLALGVEQAEPDTMGRPPRRPGESLFVRGLWQHVLAMGLVTGAVSLGLGLWGQATGRPWQTMIFTSLALLQLGNALAVRSECQSVFGWALAVTGSWAGRCWAPCWSSSASSTGPHPDRPRPPAPVPARPSHRAGRLHGRLLGIEAENLIRRLRATQRTARGGPKPAPAI